jgi:hypothetical protein
MMRLANKKTAANQKKAEKPAAKNFAADSSQGEKRNPPKETRIARLRNLVPDKQVGQTTSSIGVSVLSAAYLNYDKKDFFPAGLRLFIVFVFELCSFPSQWRFYHRPKNGRKQFSPAFRSIFRRLYIRISCDNTGLLWAVRQW